MNNKEFNIINFLQKESFNTIKNKLLEQMNNSKYCDKILGEGMMGIVYEPVVNNKILINKKIELPVVIKYSKNDGEFSISEIDKKLYICGFQNITTEAIILSYINKLWHLNPHLPYMIGYSMCNNGKQVNKIITHKQGLTKNVEIESKNFYNEDPIWGNKFNINNSNNIATLYELFKYIIIKIDNKNKVKLPNNEICDVTELLNYLTISCICTHHFLHKNNIICNDIYSSNIFIHWLDNNSYLGKNIKYIYYKINKKIIKIKTFGIILKIGDTGAFMVNPRKNLYIIGYATNLHDNYKVLKQMMKENYSVVQFINNFKYHLNEYIYNKTIAFKILNSHPYNKLYLSLNTTKLLNQLLTPIELLDNYFFSYYVNKINVDNKKNIVVTI
jgi:hypothetical protein